MDGNFQSSLVNDNCFAVNRMLIGSDDVIRDDKYVPEGEFGMEDTGIYYRRLIRDGWNIVNQQENSRWNSETIFEKTLPNGWILRKIAHEQIDSPKGKGCYWDEHKLIAQAHKS